jgi:hypothetical protein
MPADGMPANGGYMVAAYTVAAVIYLGYALSLWRRGRRLVGPADERVDGPSGGR